MELGGCLGSLPKHAFITIPGIIKYHSPDADNGKGAGRLKWRRDYLK